MSITLGYSRQSAPSALRIAEASGGRIVAVKRGDADVNWGRRSSTGLNPDITNSVNKRVMRELFAAHGVPAPRLFTPDEARQFLADEAGWVIGRPDFHTRGRGYWRCETISDLERALHGTRRKAAATHFIEFVPLEREFRVHIFKGASIRISEKLHTDFHKYTTVKPEGRKRHIRKAAKNAVEALGLDFGCVDILADENQAFALEVNAAPGLGGSMPRVWAQTFINWKEGTE